MPSSATSQRLSFIGRNGSLSRPAALLHLALEPQFGAGLDPCAALHVQVVLKPGERRRMLFLLGQGTDAAHVEQLIARHGSVDDAEVALQHVQTSWNKTLETIQVQHAGRFLRRADQPMAALSGRELPPVDRGGLLPAGRRLRVSRSTAGCDGAAARAARARAGASAPRRRPAVRRRRRPALVARTERTRTAIAVLGRSAVAAVRRRRVRPHDGRHRRFSTSACRFWMRRCFRRTAHEVYGQPRVSPESGTLFEHCVRAIEKGLTTGAHGLPLFGSGDWNDGMNRVGAAGRGESTWLGFFLHVVHERFRAALPRAQRRRTGRPLRQRSAPARGQAPTGVGRRMVPARVLRRRDAAGIRAERRVHDRFDLAVVGGALGRRPDRLCRARHGRRSHVSDRARIADAAAAQPAVRSIDAGAGLHQGLSAGRPRERRPVHARGRVDRDGPGQTGKRRRGDGVLPHAEPDQPWPHAGRRRPATRRSRTWWPATSTRDRRTPDAADGAGTRDRPAGCIAPASRAFSACGGAATRSSSTRAFPTSWPEYRITWQFLVSRYEITVIQSRCAGAAAW